jgi:hypothetical protein
VVGLVGIVRWLAWRAKPYSWRVTAAYFWVTAIAAVIGLGGTVAGTEDLLFKWLSAALAVVGFEPANQRYLEAVLKILWVLTITNFRLLGLLGLAAYILSIPVWLPATYFINRYLSASGSEPLTARNVRRSEDRPFDRPFPLVTAFMILLAGWFVLYGGSSQWGQILPGIILSGLLLVSLSFQLFLRVRPVRIRNAGAFSKFTDVGERLLAQYPVVPTKQYQQADEIKGEMIIMRFFRRWSTRLAVVLRRPRTRDAAAALVFADYIGSLVIITVVAIVFWSLTISVAANEPIPLLPALQASIAYLIPGLGGQAPELPVPYWTRVGSAVTGWVLFVLYIGPAASVLPERQKVVLAELAIAQRRFRDIGSELSRGLRNRTRIAASMSEET